MSKPLFVIGIDGGATKTTAILCALDSTILAEAQGGPSNFQIIGIEQSAITILDLVESCCRSIRCSVSQIGAIVAGLAGAGRSTDQQRMLEGLQNEAQRRSLSLENVIVESDARIALEGAFSGEPGIIVIAGTGSIVFGKDENGRTYRVGGWGRLIGDEGSGYTIGKEAFSAVAKVLDKRGEKTKLVKIFDKKFGLGTQENIITALYKENFNIATVAPGVMEAALKGDKVAKRILKTACSDLLDLISALIAKMNKKVKNTSRHPLAFVGSLLTNDNVYSRKVRSAIKRNLRSVSLYKAESSPVVGAALMAIESLKS